MFIQPWFFPAVLRKSREKYWRYLLAKHRRLATFFRFPVYSSSIYHVGLKHSTSSDFQTLFLLVETFLLRQVPSHLFIYTLFSASLWLYCLGLPKGCYLNICLGILWSPILWMYLNHTDCLALISSVIRWGTFIISRILALGLCRISKPIFPRSPFLLGGASSGAHSAAKFGYHSCDTSIPTPLNWRETGNRTFTKLVL